MNPINLVTFAEHSQKLPATLLAPPKARPQTWKILLGHSMDFMMAVTLVSVMVAMFNVSVSTLMVTQGLHGIFKFSTLESFSGAVIPFVVFNYFFVSYFLNHGQSWGLLLMRKRLPMPSKSFRSAVRWATHSSLLCFSGGFTFLLFQDVWNEIQDNDYLYQDLLRVEEKEQVDLQKLLNDREINFVESAEFKTAA